MHQQQKIQLDISLAIRLRESSSRSYGGSCSYASAGAGHCNWAITITRVVNLLFAFSVSAFHILFWWCILFSLYSVYASCSRGPTRVGQLCYCYCKVFFFCFLSFPFRKSVDNSWRIQWISHIGDMILNMLSNFDTLAFSLYYWWFHSRNFAYLGYSYGFVIELQYSSLILIVTLAYVIE